MEPMNKGPETNGVVEKNGHVEKNGDVEKQNGTNGVAHAKMGDDQSDSSEVRLKREVGLIGGIALIVGSMIGSGIFVSPKGILRKTESVGMSFIIWLLCALLSMCGK